MSAPLALRAELTVRVGAGREAFTVASSLTLARGVLVLFGPSGAGKSLTIQALAGLLRPTGGRIAVQGEVLYDAAARVFVPPERRRIGYVPQLHALFPFLDVSENLAFGLPRKERRRDNPQVLAMLEELGLARLARAKPTALSGGERQRVALGRALLVEPRLLLLDEPFASIDQEGRASLRASLRAAIDRRGMSAVLVTHDPEEARALGDQVVRFERGRSTVTGAPGEVLGEREGVTIAGVVEGSVEALGRGRARVIVRHACVEGPEALFEGVEAGEARIEVGSGRAPFTD